MKGSDRRRQGADAKLVALEFVISGVASGTVESGQGMSTVLIRPDRKKDQKLEVPVEVAGVGGSTQALTLAGGANAGRLALATLARCLTGTAHADLPTCPPAPNHGSTTPNLPSASPAKRAVAQVGLPKTFPAPFLVFPSFTVARCPLAGTCTWRHMENSPPLDPTSTGASTPSEPPTSLLPGDDSGCGTDACRP
ncbi:hypothetical protein CPLU01_09705 [Colletotrichum plurivorum]|uniref:Uncharacterized protein n=1 Tax=Colletotrichum plurivorum TaxID=2175906 RepID=A0A8H6NB46_9PEZI|nr:hypothetical protein CPLU01_09705 [Colletotrichum plurivorum]